jgi:anti-sigma-K factor RskA
MKIDTPELRHALAAEYVLGTLRGRARERFKRLAAADAALAAVVAKWEDFLTPLAGAVAPEEPPSRVWKAIEARTAVRAARTESARPMGIWTSLAFWRSFGLGLTAMLALLVFFGPLRAPAPVEPTVVAVLAAADQVPRMIVEQAQPGVLKVRMVKGWLPQPGKDFELWVVPKEGAPRSLGVISYERDTVLQRQDIDSAVKEGVSFAVSREPLGGSPTGTLTSPPLCTGSIARPKRA